MNPSNLLPSMGKFKGRLSSLALVRQPVQKEKKKTEFKQLYSTKKLTLCHILPVIEGLVNSMFDSLDRQAICYSFPWIRGPC